MEKIKNFLDYGIHTQAYQARRNYNIYKQIADCIEEIKRTDKEVQKLFHFIQYSAQTEFVLGVSRMFDRPSKSKPYKTRCIRSSLELILSAATELNSGLRNKNFRKKLSEVGCNDEFISDLESDLTSTANIFYSHYIEEYNSELMKQKINQILHVRDKFIAHNELVMDPAHFNPVIICELTDFAMEVAEAFNILYVGDSYIPDIPDQNAHFLKMALIKYGIISEEEN